VGTSSVSKCGVITPRFWTVSYFIALMPFIRSMNGAALSTSGYCRCPGPWLATSWRSVSRKLLRPNWICAGDHSVMTFGARLSARFKANPVAWILAAAIILVEFWNYQKGVQLHRVCELTGPHNLTYGHPVTPKQELDTICGQLPGED
jgi:hypothetical protein